MNLYDQADIFLFASTTETQGLVLAEAMARGLPVIALDAPGSRDIVSNHYNGFLVHNQAEMVEAIYFMLSHKKLYEELQSNALKTSTGFAPDVVARGVEAVYRKVL
jgi:1,2-diacylglycerol 3-alpha-glucosyltransferase